MFRRVLYDCCDIGIVNNNLLDSLTVCNRGEYLVLIYLLFISTNCQKISIAFLLVVIIGNTLVNHIIYADDICCFSPSVAKLQDLLAVCDSFFSKNGIVFNSNKSQCMQFLPKSFHLTNVPVVRLCNETLNFCKKVKYLGVYLTNALTDDDDINRQVRSLYCSANQLKSAFSRCLFDAKNLLFKSYFTNFYGSHLWSNYLKSSFHRIRVAYNDCYRMLHNLPRYTSAREFQVVNHIPIFEALLRKTLYNFINRCLNSSNLLVTNMMNIYCFYDSQFFTYYSHMLYRFQ